MFVKNVSSLKSPHLTVVNSFRHQK